MVGKSAQLTGRLAFWLSWPLSYIVVRRTIRARVLVRCSGYILLVQSWHSSGGWSLPGGGIHTDELPAAAAARELHEETGVSVAERQLQPLGEASFRASGLPVKAVYFLVELNDQPAPSAGFPEILDAAWVTIDELDTLELQPDVRQALALAKA